MKFSKLTLAIAAILRTGASTTVSGLDLYVDTKTEQIYAKPGPGRVHMGSFVREDAPAQITDRTAEQARERIPDKTAHNAARKKDAAKLVALRRDMESKAEMREAALASEIAPLEEQVKETEKQILSMDPDCILKALTEILPRLWMVACKPIPCA